MPRFARMCFCFGLLLLSHALAAYRIITPLPFSVANNKYNTYPTHGHVGNDCYYRIHYPDVIVYEQALDMQFETWQDYYIASVVWYYERDGAAVRLTDWLDILNAASEKAHRYSNTGETWSGEKRGPYPGLRIYNDTLRDGGRAVTGVSEFEVTIDRGNQGIRLRTRTDNRNFQKARVYIDGVAVAERPWYISKNNYNALWVDSDFEVPAAYTQGKERLKIKIEPAPGSPVWSAYRYEVYSYVP